MSVRITRSDTGELMLNHGDQYAQENHPSHSTCNDLARSAFKLWRVYRGVQARAGRVGAEGLALVLSC